MGRRATGPWTIDTGNQTIGLFTTRDEARMFRDEHGIIGQIRRA